jgi:hypothetical protein
MATSEIPFHSEQWSGLVTEDLEGKAERALAVWEDGLEDALTVRVLPEKSRTRWRTTHGLERLHAESRRRERCTGFAPMTLLRSGRSGPYGPRTTRAGAPANAMSTGRGTVRGRPR